MKSIFFSVILFLTFISCHSNADKKESETTADNTIITATPVSADRSGNYVSADYANRAKGFDWVAIVIKNISGDSVAISVRSRADKKKPTCTFDAVAHKQNDSTYLAVAQGKNILFTFNNNELVIATENTADSGVLNYFCSGGGSLSGSYTKINEPLDESQIDKTTIK